MLLLLFWMVTCLWVQADPTYQLSPLENLQEWKHLAQQAVIPFICEREITCVCMNSLPCRYFTVILHRTVF